jgi:NADPH:quinone reductase-like Zn-dependent oxidoreductase
VLDPSRVRAAGLNAVTKKKDVLTLSELIGAGKVRPVIARVYPLIEAPDAIRYVEQGHPRGKVIIAV